ncbi:hypothetical protein RYX36_010833 [Vicia faba]
MLTFSHKFNTRSSHQFQMIILCGFKKTEQQKVIKKKTKPPLREPLPKEQLLQASPNLHWPTLAVVPESQPLSSVTSNSTAAVRASALPVGATASHTDLHAAQ